VATSPVNLERYPLDRPESDEYRRLVREGAQSFRDGGVALLPNFLTEQGLRSITVEADRLVSTAFFCRNEHDVYLNTDGQGAADAVDRPMRTDVGSIANDYLEPGGALQQLYDSGWLPDFIAEVVGVDKLFVSEDPLGAVSINVFAPGDAHAWHFDESLFTVTVMVQEAAAGGFFEYVHGVRGPDFDDHDAMNAIFDGDESSVQRLAFSAGTLSIFAGRHTMHRVTKVGGDRHRFVPVLTFATEPGYRNSDEVRELFWGRAS